MSYVNITFETILNVNKEWLKVDIKERLPQLPPALDNREFALIIILLSLFKENELNHLEDRTNIYCWYT